MITDYRFGQIVVDGTRYTSDVMILPQRVIPGWYRQQGHSLCVEDLTEIVGEMPELLIVGTGSSSQLRVTSEAKKHLEANNIELIVQDTASACQTYDCLCRTRKVAAALHLTC